MITITFFIDCISASPLIEASESQQLTQLIHLLIQANEPHLISQLVSDLKHLLRAVEIRIETGLHVRAIIDCHLKYNTKSLPINTPKISTAELERATVNRI